MCVGVLHENYLAEAAAHGRITFNFMSVNMLRNNCIEMARSINSICGGDNGTSNAVQQRLNFLPVLGHEKIYVIGRLISVSYTLASSSSWESEDGVSWMLRNVIKSLHHKCGIIIQE